VHCGYLFQSYRMEILVGGRCRRRKRKTKIAILIFFLLFISVIDDVILPYCETLLKNLESPIAPSALHN